MNLTLLLDLDDTLLDNDASIFLPHYLKSLASYLAPYADPDRLIKVLMEATSAMEKNNQPTLTLKEVFDAAFYPGLGIKPQDIARPIETFYDESFPKIKSITKPMPGALELVNEAFKRGYKVAVATTPLFPYTAVDQRLGWAGLSPESFAFSIVPSFETFHFAKPNPAYFGELLGRMGWPDGCVIMIGDDQYNDIQPAKLFGLPTYWVKKGSLAAQSQDGDEASGPLSAIKDWLDTSSPEKLQPDFTIPSAMLAILRSTPATLKALSSNVDIELWSHRPSQNEWCLTEVLCHLRDVEVEVNLPRVSRVLEEDNPFIPGKDTDPWAEQRGYINQDGPGALEDFIQARLKLLAMLDQITERSWMRQARHAIFGPTSLAELVNFNASHDRLHIQQIYKNIQILEKEASKP